MHTFPLVRTDAQARLLAVLFERPGFKRPLGQVAKRAGVPASTASKEIARLIDQGLVVSESLGRLRIVQGNWDLPWAEELATILDHTVGIPWAVDDALHTVGGIDDAYVFGSWAARRAGEPGPDPADLDVLVVGAADRDEIRAALKPLERRLGRHIDPTVVSAERWADEDDPFVATIRDRPLYRVFDSARTGT